MGERVKPTLGELWSLRNQLPASPVNHALISPVVIYPVLYDWHFSHWFRRLTTLVIHHPFTVSFQA